MTARWNTPNVPHKGWKCLDVVDVRADGESAEKANYEVCQMCGQERIRFVHIMEHSTMPSELRVGCICAEKMSDDYVAPKERERELRNRSTRRAKWLTRKWKVSRKGHPWIKAGDYHIVVCAEGRAGQYRLFINEKRGQRLYPSESAAKLAAFDAVEKMKERGKL